MTNRASAHGPRLGFTLIELLVVIAIIALLISILLPALGKARCSASTLRVESAIKQFTTGYLAYSQDNRDQLMPASMHWDWVHASNRWSMYPVDLTDTTRSSNSNGLMGDTIAKVWTWNLMGYLNYDLTTIQIDRATFDEFNTRPRNYFQPGWDTTGRFHAYANNTFEAAVGWHPSFGINGVYVGGAYNFGAFRQTSYGGITGRPAHNTRTNGGMFYITRASDANRPDRLLAFASSRGADVSTSGSYWDYGAGRPEPSNTTAGTVRPGYYIVTPPKPHPCGRGNGGTVPYTTAWGSPPATAGVSGWVTSNKFDPRAPSSSWGMLNVNCADRVTTSALDGHAEFQTIEQLRDMTRWSNFARKVGNTPASDWTFEPGP